MKYLPILLLLPYIFLSTATVHAKTNDTKKEPGNVLMMGIFHFSNPSLDTVKTDKIDVSTPDNQQYLISLAQRIAKEYKPNHVLVECDPKQQTTLNKSYKSFIAGNADLPIGETYQIGFRIAKHMGTEPPICYDEREIQWKSGPLMVAMPNIAPEVQQDFNRFITKITNRIAHMQSNMDLSTLLKAHNNSEFDALNKSLYLLTNSVGAGANFEGADAAASWWHRNFRMYANIQSLAKPNTRIFEIGGQGHTAIMKDFLESDSKIESEDINDYL